MSCTPVMYCGPGAVEVMTKQIIGICLPSMSAIGKGKANNPIRRYVPV